MKVLKFLLIPFFLIGAIVAFVGIVIKAIGFLLIWDPEMFCNELLQTLDLFEWAYENFKS